MVWMLFLPDWKEAFGGWKIWKEINIWRYPSNYQELIDTHSLKLSFSTWKEEERWNWRQTQEGAIASAVLLFLSLWCQGGRVTQGLLLARLYLLIFSIGGSKKKKEKKKTGGWKWEKESQPTLLSLNQYHRYLLEAMAPQESRVSMLKRWRQQGQIFQCKTGGKRMLSGVAPPQLHDGKVPA